MFWRLKNDDRGSAIVETALLILVLSGLVYGIIAVLNGIRTDIALQIAAREGAREYAAYSNQSLGIAKANEELQLLNISNANINIKNEGSVKGVEVTKTYSYTIPLFGTYNKTLKGVCYFQSE